MKKHRAKLPAAGTGPVPLLGKALAAGSECRVDRRIREEYKKSPHLAVRASKE
jgi:hypothetical protein